MRLIRRIFVIACLLAISAMIWAGIYARKQGFTNSWRKAVEIELANQGYHIDIGKLTLGAFRGLVAEDVRFFRDKERTQQFAEMDDIFLDVGLGRVLKKQITIKTLDFRKGQLRIPLAAGQSSGARNLLVTGLSGRIALTDSFVEVVEVEANLAGVDIFMKGAFLRSPNLPGNQLQGKEAFEASMLRLQSLKKFVDLLGNFEFPDGAPMLKVDFRGDLRDLSQTTARVELKADKFRKKRGGYEVLSFDLDAKLDGRIRQLKISKFLLKDGHGVFNGDGVWNRKSEKLDFRLNSDADLVNLMEFFFPNRKWREVVFYQPPVLIAEGTIDLDSGNEKRFGRLFPGRIIGEFQTEGFGSAGQVFKASRGDFSVKDDSFYVRNLRVDHKSGVAFLNGKYEPGQGRNSLQFQSAIKMDPRVFAPFFKDEETRRFLRKWSFRDDSGVHLEASGQSSSLDLSDLQARGEIDLRNFRLNNISFRELEAKFEIEGGERWYRDVVLSREDGEIAAALVYTNTDKRIWEIKGGSSTVDLIEGFGAFSPMVKENLSVFQFASPPSVKIQGMIDGRSSEQRGSAKNLTDLEISFSANGSVPHRFLGKELPLDSPEGILLVREESAHIKSFKAGLCGGTFEMDLVTPNFRAPKLSYQASIKAQEIGLRSLGKIYGFENDAVGYLDGQFQFTGRSSKVTGTGNISVSNRDLFRIPIFKDLEGLLDSEEPAFSYPMASIERSRASFEIKEGIFVSTDVSLLPGTVDLIGNTRINFLQNIIEAELSPENNESLRVYRCNGTFDAPDWKVITGRRYTTVSGSP